MNTSHEQRFAWHIDWRWVFASYCYLVLFHLLPTFLLGGFSMGAFTFQVTVRVSQMNLASVWLFPGLAVVAFVVGYRSRGVTIIEPALAGVAYAITTSLGFAYLWTPVVRNQLTVSTIFWLLVVVIITSVAAWMGEKAQERRERRG